MILKQIKFILGLIIIAALPALVMLSFFSCRQKQVKENSGNTEIPVTFTVPVIKSINSSTDLPATSTILPNGKKAVFILEVPAELKKYITLNMQCSLDLPDSKPINGKITGELTGLDNHAQILKYVIEPVENADLPEGLIANVRLWTSEKENAIVLPRKAVLEDETLTRFWVMKIINDSTAIKVPVKKGLENIDEIEITDPVFTPIDRIILTGNYGLPDTARVFIVHH